MENHSSEIVELYRAAGLLEAHTLLVLLEGEGIAARIENESLQGAAGELPFGWNTAPRVIVTRTDEPAAREILADYLRTSEGPRASTEGELHCLACGNSMGEASACPKCGWSYRDESSNSNDSEPLEPE